MKKISTLLAALIAAFFMSSSIRAEEACHPVDMESVLTKGIEESPDLLMAVLEGEPLESFWNQMREKKILIGTVGVDKIYVFYSENHPSWVYVYFLTAGCIVDVKFTYKNLVEELLK